MNSVILRIIETKNTFFVYSMKEKTMPVWLKKAANIFSIFEIPRVPQHGEKQKSKYRREVVRQTADGNALLQLGHYLTEEDIDRLKKAAIFVSTDE